MLVGAAGIALLLLWPALLGLSITLMLLASVQMVLLYRLGQPVVETGSALVSFIENLDIECRRSVREFTPLTVMYLGAKHPCQRVGLSRFRRYCRHRYVVLAIKLRN